LVTHDRFLLDVVTTTVLGLDGEGNAGLFADSNHMEAWQEEQRSLSRDALKPVATAATSSGQQPAQKKKLSYMEAREFATIEQRIHDAEATLEEKKALMSHPDVVVDGRRLQQTLEEMAVAQEIVDKLYERWSELEAKSAG
jgi:ATP-binding cassette subfamily F protein uup